MKTPCPLLLLAALLLAPKPSRAEDLAPLGSLTTNAARFSDREPADPWKLTPSGASLSIGAAQLKLYVAARQLSITFLLSL